MDENEAKQLVVVLGAGVIGLTTALCLLDQYGGKYQVTIVAEVWPTDPKSVGYTSHWAGAHHVGSAPANTRQGELNRATFQEMWRLSEEGEEAEHCFLRMIHTELFVEDPSPSPSQDGYVSPYAHLPEYRRVQKADLPLSAQFGESFQTVTIEPERYLHWLFSEFLKRGGTIHKGHIKHIDEIIEATTTSSVSKELNGKSPHAIFVCVGLGARTLGGVEDEQVYPSRGQTVILRTPWVRFGLTYSQTALGSAGESTYIIPRRSGDVVVGGVHGVNDWYPNPRVEVRDDLLKRGIALCPELVSPEIRAVREGTMEDLLPLIVEEGCGMRPMRKGGCRIELESRLSTRNGEKVNVVYNYGHGSIGYISSFGAAKEAIRLLENQV